MILPAHATIEGKLFFVGMPTGGGPFRIDREIPAIRVNGTYLPRIPDFRVECNALAVRADIRLAVLRTKGLCPDERHPHAANGGSDQNRLDQLKVRVDEVLTVWVPSWTVGIRTRDECTAGHTDLNEHNTPSANVRFCNIKGME
jgi:hypothetical protein